MRQVLKVDFVFDLFAERLDDTQIDIRLEQGCTNFFKRGIELLKSTQNRRRTFSSMGAEPLRSRKAVVSRRPRSARTMVGCLLALSSFHCSQTNDFRYSADGRRTSENHNLDRDLLNQQTPMFCY